MTESNLPDLLERAGARLRVGPAPLDRMIAAAHRRRRRRAMLTAVVGAAVVAPAVAVAALVLPPGGADPQPPVASPSPIQTPPGARLVGFGPAAVAVPDSWGTNATRCGVPQADTVVIDVGAVPLCAIRRPDGVESVELTQGPPRFDFHADETVEVDGVTAQRQATACPESDSDDPSTCSGTLYFPGLEISFRAESSTSATEVDRILDRIRIVPDLVGVPGFGLLATEAQGRSGELYLAALAEVGLDAEVETTHVPLVDTGQVLAISPAPGTMLRPGQTVTVTVAAEPDGAGGK